MLFFFTLGLVIVHPTFFILICPLLSSNIHIPSNFYFLCFHFLCIIYSCSLTQLYYHHYPCIYLLLFYFIFSILFSSYQHYAPFLAYSYVQYVFFLSPPSLRLPLLPIKWKSRIAVMLNEQDSLGWSPLHHASRAGQISSLTSLLQLGASVRTKDNRNESPLHFAAKWVDWRMLGYVKKKKRGILV